MLLVAGDQLIKAQLKVAGIVQGVGFRPFVYRLAQKYNLSGFVRNAGGKVEVEIEGSKQNVECFIYDLKSKAPPLAVIKQLQFEQMQVEKVSTDTFSILESTEDDLSNLLVPSDTAICADCLRELFDEKNRRFQYPFINCVNCGPRFTVINELPYDRKSTTMSEFQMCAQCLSEYNDPLSRRFHAQPNACFDCGPRQILIDFKTGKEKLDDIIETAKQLLIEGRIIALKGLGGFQLVCDATNEFTVNKLRERKIRPSKPFAVMLKNLEMTRDYCLLSYEEQALLTSKEAPIVLLERRLNSDIARSVGPNISLLGVMLPYTPIHYLLAALNKPLVVTSGNVSEKPIAFENGQALRDLASVADYCLLHDREISSRYDDSVARIISNMPVIVRRARGYAPQPIETAYDNDKTILSLGGHLKNTFCFLKDKRAFISPHIGDLDNLETIEHCQNTIERYRQLFKFKEELLVCDMHPDYASTKLAQQFSVEKEIPLIKVQHHHAHIVSCMAEYNLSGPVIGVAFDGSGYGTDGTIWGGEFVIADLKNFTRYACFEPVRMPGGEQAIRQPWRMALSYIGDDDDLSCVRQDIEKHIGIDKVQLVAQQTKKGFNSPFTSSCGRLFDAVSSMLGICQQADYEGQAALELESIAREHRSDTSVYSYSIIESIDQQNPRLRHISFKKMLGEIAADKRNATSISTIAYQFHNTLAQIIIDICDRIRKNHLINVVCLSGGVFQNSMLLNEVIGLLRRQKFAVYFNCNVPTNDGGLSLGQAIIAAAQ